MDSIVRMKGEPRKSNRRLCLFVGFDGTLQDFELFLKENHKDLSVSLSQLQKDSSRWNWKKRKNEYKQLEEERLRNESESMFNELNRKGMEDMNVFFDVLNDLKKDLLIRYGNGEITSTNVLRVLKDYIRLYRQATEIYYINSRHQLQPIETENDSNDSMEAVNTFLNAMKINRENHQMK